MRIKEAINRILWKYRESLDEFLLVIVDRTTSSGYRYILFSKIKDVDNNYVYLSNELQELTVIPLHRVVRIEKKNGEIIWQR